MINTYIYSIRSALQQKNWYCALAFALVLPDICGGVGNHTVNSKNRNRYIAWYDQYVKPRFKEVFSDGSGPCLLSGSDCYALRCSFLHSGSENILDQRARQQLKSFYFIEPHKGWLFNTRAREEILHIQVDRFCELLCKAAETWAEELSVQPYLLKIYNPKTDGIPL